MFIGVTISAFAYGVLKPPQQWLESGLIRVLGVLLGIGLVRLLFWKYPKIGAGLILLGINIATPILITGGNFNNSFAVLSIATLPTLFLSIVWGWRGGILALIACLPVSFLKSSSTPEETIIGWVILCGTAFSGSLIHFLIKDVDSTRSTLELMARTDALTKLGNRFALEADFDKLDGTGFLCMWDVNGLKRVNDSQGHHAGDAYLLKFVAAYQSHSQVPLYRVGGDEFVCFLPPETDCPNLYSSVKKSFPDIAAGWVALEQRDLDTVMRYADRAMYLEKGKRLKATDLG